ncbi:MAG TPA: DUF6230 family protein [Streptosporangiaceae bacterium]
MSESAQSGPRARSGRVKWKRFAVVMVPSAVVAAVLIGLTAQGAIGANISVSGQEYLVTANQLSGTGFEQFGSVLPQGNNHVPVAVSAIKSANLTNLCQAVKVGGITLLLRAGSASNPVHADNLIVDASSLAGNATFHNIAIGQDAGTLNEVPGTTGTPGTFGEQASDITIKNLVQNTWLTTAGTFTLPGLSLKVSTSGGSCP